MRRISIALALSLAAASAPSGAAPDYLATLQADAKAQELAAAPEWRALLHYRLDLVGHGYTSEALTPAFFLAPDGRTDPTSELLATLASFFKEPPAEAPDASTQCLFIARYQWLKQRLHFDPQQLRPQPCPEFARWYSAIDPGSLVLIFPAAYLNSPASMYGHTFLRFDHPHQPEATHLESYSVNFAAQTADSGGFIFAYKGLTGLYAGSYSLAPYYLKVREYSDIEDRDIWEYELNYTPEEVRRILEHMWEVRQVTFPYYFFSRNCSYALLTLMDVARPDTPLAAHFTYQVIPSDTVKTVVTQPGMLKAAVYRPSLASRIRQRLARMDGGDQQLALYLADGKLPPDADTVRSLSSARQADIYATAADYLLYRGYRGEELQAYYAPRTLAIQRADNRVNDSGVSAPTAPDTDPSREHGSSRAGIGFGRLDDGDYVQADFRAAYHDLLDPAAGFADGAEINMLGLGVRNTADDHRTHLEYLNLVEVVSLAPRDALFRPLSWDVSAGWDRRWISASDRPLVGDLHGGAGLSYQLGSDALAYGLAQTSLLTNGGIPGSYAAGFGLRTGLLWHVTPWWNTLLSAEVQRFPDQLHFTAVDYRLGQNFTLAPDLALQLTFSRQGDLHSPVNEATLQLMWYF